MSTDTPIELQFVVSPAVDVAIGGTFSPTTATIVTRPTEAVLVDTLYTPDDVKRLAQAVGATGKTADDDLHHARPFRSLLGGRRQPQAGGPVRRRRARHPRRHAQLIRAFH